MKKQIVVYKKLPEAELRKLERLFEIARFDFIVCTIYGWRRIIRATGRKFDPEACVDLRCGEFPKGPG